VRGVTASGYFEHWRRKNVDQPTKPGVHSRASDERLLVEIRAIHAQVKHEYGWPKMWKELVARGHRVGKERVRRLMQKHGIRARCKRKFVVTTDSKHHLPRAPDLLQRNFARTLADRPSPGRSAGVSLRGQKYPRMHYHSPQHGKERLCMAIRSQHGESIFAYFIIIAASPRPGANPG
jgi:transposase InsO family protein